MSMNPLRADLELTWQADTSVDAKEWSPEHKSRGQCAVTALVVNKMYGGEILRVEIADTSHYWNRLPDGKELDLTRDQFEQWEPTGDVETRTPEQLLANQDTQARFDILWRRLGELWWT